MGKITIFPLLITLLFVQWNSCPVESANNSEAKVTGASQKTDDPRIGVVEDEDAKSGWAVEIKKHISKKETEDKFFVYFYTRNDPKAEFKVTFAIQLCNLLQNREQSKNTLPKQIIDMMFPKQKGSCEFKVSERAIRAAAQVNTNFDDNGGYFPKTTPYEMEVRIVTYLQSLDSNGDQYLFNVNFNIGGDINKKSD